MRDQPLALEGDELKRHAESARRVMGHLDVEADELCPGVLERVGQPISQIAHPHEPALANLAEAGLSGCV